MALQGLAMQAGSNAETRSRTVSEVRPGFLLLTGSSGAELCKRLQSEPSGYTIIAVRGESPW